MPRRRSSLRALKSWSAAMRAALRIARKTTVLGQQLGKAPRPKRAAAAKKKASSGTVAARAKATNAKPASPRVARTPEATSPLRPGAAESGRFRNAAGTRSYRLYRPVNRPATGVRPPIILLLHGCAQDAVAFVESTRMLPQAEAAGCWVLAPEQTDRANRLRCWNWFEPAHQQRGAGEPSILAGLARKMVREHQLDSRRVFVAGISAGGAMAVVLARTYPDLFSAVGVYAGMPYGVARTAATAVAAMQGRHRSAIDAALAAGQEARPVRTLVFQGDRDKTVVPCNADAIVADALAAFGPLPAVHEQGTAGGRSFERIRHRLPGGVVAVEQWTVHGAGHVWSGGTASKGSETAGPDASAVMLDFFLQPHG